MTAVDDPVMPGIYTTSVSYLAQISRHMKEITSQKRKQREKETEVTAERSLWGEVAEQ